MTFFSVVVELDGKALMGRLVEHLAEVMQNGVDLLSFSNPLAR